MTTEAAPRTPPWAKPWVCAAIVLVLALPRIYFAARYNLIGDEAYYAIWSLYPGFGYFDHPPAVAWVIWLSRLIFGEGDLGVRGLFIVSSLLTSAALYRIAILLLNDARVGAAAAIAYAAAPAIVLTFAVATPDGPSTFFWVASIWAVAEFTRSRNPWWWLLVGAFGGLGLLSKYTVAFLGLGLVVYLVTSRERLAWLKLWQVWAGGALAVVMFAPVVWIDSQRNWLSFRFQLGRSSLDDTALRFRPDELIRFFTEESILLLPTLAVFVLIGLTLFALRRNRSLALPVLTSLPMLLYFIVDACFGRVNPNWTMPMFPALALVGATAAVLSVPHSRWFRWPLQLLKVLHVPLGMAVAIYALVGLETRTLPGIGPLPALGYVSGWPGFQAKVSDLASEQGAKWVDTHDYGLNGGLGYYGHAANDPLPVYQANNPYRYRTYLPPMPTELAAAAHLSVFEARGNTPPVRDGLIYIARLTRDDDAGTPVGTYDVYLSD